MEKLPAWAAEAISKYTAALNLNHWRIEVSIAQCIEENPYIMAQCDQYHNLSKAIIHIRSDMEDTQDWHVAIIHELMHVAHATIDTVLEQVVFPQLPESARAVSSATYTQIYEQFTHNLATSFYLALRGDE